MKHIRSYTLLFALMLIAFGCNKQISTEENISDKSNEELIKILEDQEDSNDLFTEVTEELAKRGPSASEAAPALSLALTYPRRDAYLAGFALMAMGTDAKTAIPTLYSELLHERSTVRRYAALSLGTIGQASECAVPRLASLLWNSDSETRAAASIAIDAITAANLVDPESKIDPKAPGAMPLDEPEGIVSEPARSWWLEIGQNMDWPTESCEVQT